MTYLTEQLIVLGVILIGLTLFTTNVVRITQQRAIDQRTEELLRVPICTFIGLKVVPCSQDVEG